MLTITASNRNRLMLDSPISQTFLKSIQWQDYTDFELLIVDGGSHNYEQLEKYFDKCDCRIPMRIIQFKIGEVFERARLNNVGIRNAKNKYIMTTDVDMIFGRQFVSTLIDNLSVDTLVESKTMYLKSIITKQIYEGKLDPYNNLNSIKKGRIKRETTAGGCQAMHIESWNKIHGFNEAYIGWGSEDYDLLQRASKAGIKIKWIGTSMKNIMLFHQSHPKDDIKKDLEYQEKNKKLLYNIKTFVANPNGWGGIKNG